MESQNRKPLGTKNYGHIPSPVKVALKEEMIVNKGIILSIISLSYLE
jgi:hypothetical protein